MNMLALATEIDNAALETLIGWAVILSGLSMVGVIWIIHSLRKLATNQIKIAELLSQCCNQDKS